MNRQLLSSASAPRERDAGRLVAEDIEVLPFDAAAQLENACELAAGFDAMRAHVPMGHDKAAQTAHHLRTHGVAALPGSVDVACTGQRK